MQTGLGSDQWVGGSEDIELGLGFKVPFRGFSSKVKYIKATRNKK